MKDSRVGSFFRFKEHRPHDGGFLSIQVILVTGIVPYDVDRPGKNMTVQFFNCTSGRKGQQLMRSAAYESFFDTVTPCTRQEAMKELMSRQKSLEYEVEVARRNLEVEESRLREFIDNTRSFGA